MYRNIQYIIYCDQSDESESNIYTRVLDCACSCHCLSFSHSIAFFSSIFTFLQYSISALAIWIPPRCSGKRRFRLSVSVCFAPENTLSQGTDDAGMERISCAIILSTGYAEPLSCTTND